MTTARHNYLWKTGDPIAAPVVGVPGMSDLGDPANMNVSLGTVGQAVVAPESMALHQVAEAGAEDQRLAGVANEGTTGLTQTRPIEMQIWG